MQQQQQQQPCRAKPKTHLQPSPALRCAALRACSPASLQSRPAASGLGARRRAGAARRRELQAHNRVQHAANRHACSSTVQHREAAEAAPHRIASDRPT
jgi:hypothetical protein